jgi:uracil phosphoribosyltransferase
MCKPSFRPIRAKTVDEGGAALKSAAGFRKTGPHRRSSTMAQPDLPKNLFVVNHPLILHKLTLMRDKSTPSAVFRQLLREISLLLAYEVARDLPITTQTIETPLAEMEAPILKGKKLVIVSILRAGNGLLEGMLDLMPSARIGHIGLYRDPETLQPVEYYLKVPEDISERPVIVVDPMLATGNSVSYAIKRLKEKGAKDIRQVCGAHPDVKVYTAAVDSHLNDHGYIVPGLGDAGDRMFGTK